MIKIFVIDDHIIVREGLKKILEQGTIDIKICGESSNGNGVLGQLNDKDPDIIVLDIALPGKSGLEVLKDIKERYPKLPVLMLSMHPEERFAVRALKAGASGYLTKSSISDQLINAIRKIVTQKKKYISPSVAEQLANQVDINNNVPLHQSLSDREFQVMCMIGSGKDVNKIANELSLSIQTIHTYRRRIKDKMKLNSNVEITRYALNNGLID